jgi:hypothetical protein
VTARLPVWESRREMYCSLLKNVVGAPESEKN